MGGGEEEDVVEPLSMAWPDTWRKRITYVCVLPLILPLWLTLPDTRKPESRKFFAITFVGSILWIAIFSYLMVWWATVTGEAFSIPPEVKKSFTFLIVCLFICCGRMNEYSYCNLNSHLVTTFNSITSQKVRLLVDCTQNCCRFKYSGSDQLSFEMHILSKSFVC